MIGPLKKLKKYWGLYPLFVLSVYGRLRRFRSLFLVDDLLDGLLEVVHADRLAAPPDGEHAGLGDDGLDVGAARILHLPDDLRYVHVRLHGHLAGVDLEYGFTALLVRQRDLYDTVEPAGPQYCRVKHVYAIRGRHDPHVTPISKPVHLR